MLGVLCAPKAHHLDPQVVIMDPIIQLASIPHSALTLGQNLPEGGSVPLFFLLAGGMMLWLFGAKIIKPVFLIFGVGIGGFVGTTILPLTGLPAFDLGGFTLILLLFPL